MESMSALVPDWWDLERERERERISFYLLNHVIGPIIFLR